MGFFSKILAAFTSKAPTGSDRYLPIYVLDHRCREATRGQIDLLNELSLAEEEGGYYVRKVLHTSGQRRCFAQVEVQIWLDNKKNVTRYEVQGGRWLTAEEYSAEVARQEAEDAANDSGDGTEDAADHTAENTAEKTADKTGRG